MVFLARLLALTVVLQGNAYRVGSQDLQVDNSLVRAAASASSAHGKIHEASDRRMLLPMWTDIVDSLHHTVSGAERLVEFATSINGRYARMSSMILENNLDTIINGEFTIADMKSIQDGQTILYVNRLFSAFLNDVIMSLDTSSSLLNTMSEVHTLAREVPEFSPLTAAVTIQDRDALKAVASSLNASINEGPTCERLGEILDPLLTGWRDLTAWGQARRVARGGEPLQSSLNTMANHWVSLGTVQNSGDLSTFLNNTFREAKSMLEATENVVNLEDRVFGAAERIDMELCEPEPTHNFFITREVDDDTMSCQEFGYIARKTCQCRNPTDCYVGSENRPPPQEVKRCFRPQKRASESIDRTLCAPEAEYTFRNSEVVDLETLECEVGYFRQTCRCQFPDDCYVRAEHRPEPRELKRCFRPVNVTLD